MITIIVALFWAFICPDQAKAPAHQNNSQVTTMDGDTGGETGRIPARPPRNPTPPTNP